MAEGASASVPVARNRPVLNAAYMTAAGLFAKSFSLMFVFFATKIMGDKVFGTYTNVLSVVGLFGIITDLGMGTLAIRDVSQDRTLAVRYVSNLLVLRGLLTVVALPAILLLSLPVSSQRLAVVVYALALLPNSVSNALQLVFQFEERLDYSAVFNIVSSAATASLSLVALLLGHRILALFVVFTSVALCNAIAMVVIVYTRFLPRRLEIDPAWWAVLFKKSLPFLVLTVLNILYYRADVYILGVIKCGGTVACAPTGLYSVAYRWLDVLVLIFVASVNSASLPAFNRVVAESKADLARVMRISIVLMLALGVPVALFGTFFAREAILLLGSREFLDATPSLAVLVWAFPVFLVEGMCFNALYALHRQRVVMVAFGVTLVFNVVSNVLLVPHYSFMACSVLTVASEALNLAIVFTALRQSLGPLGFGQGLLKVAAVSLATGLVLWAAHTLTIFLAFPAGLITALLSLRLTRFFGDAEREILGRLPLVGRYTGWL